MARLWYIILLALFSLELAEGVECPEHFIQLGSFCYYFSDVEEDWAGAKGACEVLGNLENENITLAVLDYGLSPEDNQLLFDHVAKKGGTFWIGGMRDEQLGIWHWIDHPNRVIDTYANYWNEGYPRINDGNCAKISYNIQRLYLLNDECSKTYRIICQIIPKDVGFRTIGANTFYFSTENEAAPQGSWQESRDFCMALQAPNGLGHVDFAILGLSHEQDQEVLRVIAQHGKHAWLGGNHLGGGEDGFFWIDGSIIKPNSYLWDVYETGTTNSYSDSWIYAKVESTNNIQRATFYSTYYTVSYDFVCQVYF